MPIDDQFDHVRFLFETNVDIVELLKQRDPQLYRDILHLLKHKTILDHQKTLRDGNNPVKQEWREALLEASGNQLKRLYPRNQPEVFKRLQKVAEDKELSSMKALNDTNKIRWEQKFRLTTGATSDFTHLLSAAARPNNTKSKHELANAQQELLRYIDIQ